jgi:hypothetical protein
MVPNWRFGSGSGLELNWNLPNRFYHIIKPNAAEPAVFWPVPQFRQLRSLALIKYLSCDRITKWYIGKTYNFKYTVDSHCPIFDPITIPYVVSKKTPFSVLFHINSTNSYQISIWRVWGERPSTTASFTYVSYSDTLTTQILNWSQRSEFTKLRLHCIIHPAKKLWVYVLSG